MAPTLKINQTPEPNLKSIALLSAKKIEPKEEEEAEWAERGKKVLIANRGNKGLRSYRGR